MGVWRPANLPYSAVGRCSVLRVSTLETMTRIDPEVKQHREQAITTRTLEKMTWIAPADSSIVKSAVRTLKDDDKGRPGSEAADDVNCHRL